MPSASTGQEPSRVLVVEPHPTLRTVLVQRLRQDGHLTAAVANAAEALEVCQELTTRYHTPSELRLYSDGYLHALRKSGSLDPRSQHRLEQLIDRWILDPSSFIGPCLLYTSPSPRDRG